MSWTNLDADPLRTSEPEMYYREVRLLGTGASPTKVLGKGITVARTGAGVYTLTHGASPGNWCGATGATFEATTVADVNGWTAVVTNTSTTVTTVTVYSETFAAADLPAACWLNMTLRYKRVAVAT